MRSRAAVAWEAKKPLTIEAIEIGGPKAGEVLVEVVPTGVCQTDAYTPPVWTPRDASPSFSATKLLASFAKSALE